MNLFKKLFGTAEPKDKPFINPVTHVSKLAYFEAIDAVMEAKAEAEELRKEIERLKKGKS